MITITEMFGAAILELVLVGALYVLYCYSRRCGVKNKLLKNALDKTDEAFVRSMLIENQIARVKQHLAGITGNTPNFGKKRYLYRTWLEWLTSEQDAWTGLEYDKTKGFWGLFESKAFALLAQPQDPAPDANTAPAAGDGELVELRNKVADYKVQLDNLDRFRGLFFDLKGQLKDLQHDYEKMQLQLQKALLSNNQKDDQHELKELNAQLKSKNQQLKIQIEAINADFESLFAASDMTDSVVAEMPVFEIGHFEKVDKGILKIKNVVTAQNLEINEMNKLINDLQIELEDKAKLLKKTKDIEARTVEMDTVIEVLEEENNYLQEQVKTFQSTMRGNLYELEYKVKSLTVELEDKEKSRTNLQRKYNDLETEYLEVYEKLHAKKS